MLRVFVILVPAYGLKLRQPVQRLFPASLSPSEMGWVIGKIDASGRNAA